jgi:hypothetical protein
MRKVRNISLILLLVLLVGCATFDTNTYKALSSARVTYNNAQAALDFLYQQGKLTNAQMAPIIKVEQIYVSAYLAAVAAYEVYHKDPTAANQAILQTAMDAASAALATFMQNYNQFNAPAAPAATVIKPK